MANSLKQITSATFYEKLKNNDTFVLNIIANWCSDCTEQDNNIQVFIDKLSSQKVDLFNLVAQQNKAQFIDTETQALITELGGHGYPRTVFIKQGKIIDEKNVEIISEKQLINLAEKFISLL